MEKIDFESAKKALPVDGSELAHRIANIPQDIILDYIDGLRLLKERVDDSIAILHAGNASRESLCVLLLSRLSEERLQNVNDIVELLNDQEPQRRFAELVSLTYQSPSLTERKKEMVDELLEAIKRLDKYKLETVAGALITIQANTSKLIQALLCYIGKKRSDDALKQHLNKSDEKSLESMLSDCSTVEKAYEYPA
jgi:hypothetical protein